MIQCLRRGPKFGTQSQLGPGSWKGPEKVTILLSSPKFHFDVFLGGYLLWKKIYFDLNLKFMRDKYIYYTLSSKYEMLVFLSWRSNFSLRSLCRQLTNTPHFFSGYILTRITFFGAQALITCCCILYKSKKMQGWISLSPGRVNVKSRANRSLQRSSLGKNYSLRGNPAPSPTVPLLHCPQAPPCRDFLLLCRHVTLPSPITRAGQASRTWGQHSWSWRWCWLAQERVWN